MAASGGTRAIIAALVANAGIAIAKFVGYLITGSSSMLAEAVHSVADTSNQGAAAARRAAPPGARPPRSTRSATAATGTSTRSSSRCCCSALGSVFALYEGIHKLEHARAADVADRRGRHPGGRDRPGDVLASAPRSTESRPLKGSRHVVAVHPPVQGARAAGRAAGGPRRARRPGARPARRRAHRAHRQPGLRRARHDLHRRPARRHRDHPDHRDEEPADRRGRDPAGARDDRPALEAGDVSSGSSTSRPSTSGPEELLVAAKIALPPGLPLEAGRPRHRRGRGSASGQRCRRPG